MTETIRALSPDETATMIDWAAAEGWNPGLGDAAPFLAADPGGFWGLFEDGVLAATISAVRYGSAFAFVGFYICRPERRGQGVGWRLWQTVLRKLEADCVGLDGVVDQQDNYRKSGFVLAHRNVRYGGTPRVEVPDDPRLGRLTPAMAAELDAFEQEAHLFPAPRAGFLGAWLAAPDAVTCGLRTSAGLVGYGTIRPCREGCKIGPLLAPSPDDARTLVHALIAAAPAQGPVYLDPPEPNEAAVSLALDLGLSPVFETARMYRGAAPELDLASVYGITSFELG